MPYSLSALLRLVLPVLWIGLLIGVSFIATPIKFQAPSLDLPVALDVGRVTFGLFNRVEWAMAILLAFVALVSGFPRAWSLLLALLAALLALQSFWLLPELTARIETIMAGRTPPDSNHHAIYAWLEAVKLLILVILCGLPGWKLLRGASRPQTHAFG